VPGAAPPLAETQNGKRRSVGIRYILHEGNFQSLPYAPVNDRDCPNILRLFEEVSLITKNTFIFIEIAAQKTARDMQMLRNITA